MYRNINKELAKIFREMAMIYEFIGKDEDKFRALTYQRVANLLEDLPDDVRNYLISGKLEEIRGIGSHTIEKIKEYIQTGKISKYEELKKLVPPDFLQLMEIPGFGPKTLKRIYEELGITTKEELIKALKDGRIASLKGFGEKKVKNMLKGLELYEASQKRLILWEALEIGRSLVEKLKNLKEIKNIELAGSLRRKKETIGDIDILVSANQQDREKIINYFVNLEDVKEILAKGDTKASVLIKQRERQVDLRVINPDEWGSALQYFTGSKEHNVHMRDIAKSKGLKVSEYGVFIASTGEKIAGETEEGVYEAIGMQWIPPELREDRGEIEIALEKKLPKLVELSDIKGDLHVHSTWTDGMNTIQQIIEFVRERYKYEYIAITDHSKSVRVAHGLSEEDLLRQIEEIDKLNKLIGFDFIKKGIEVDILLDGSLDLSDEVLSKLDWVVASIHTHFNRDNTDRIIKACENPYVTAIGHPTGRIFGQREGYPVSDEILKVAKETGTALEINAQPNRMDLNEVWVKKGKEIGVKFVISTDSHSFGNFAYMEIGVAIARRGWCTKEDILNTKSWKEIQKFVNAKRKKFGVLK
ncbi:DNA polymerase/3'-5' exonuclease PolX [Venenivibrio stagnispumantis]|uniref:DNA polymerase beta n=1 Tax=Venenivibrio stagnispumantis TaxID=407998 RepID=A0AA46AFT9_9AQUI|nr:DNA polymerase/3'-5' exonuclease PolX [Venenivibrio stagnispumantis]MCW4573899.1 DNA polymerase/3'-5' exonuclease PolX [Venenivibrio stagnispumantis]SMP22100.1 DNA polymerase (family 10) [Venenivibrio stagnispumantis]